MTIKRAFTMILIMFCLVSTGVFLSPDTVCAAKLTNAGQAKKKALKEVKNAVITEVDRDHEKGTLVYKIQLRKGCREYDITYRASDGKKIGYGWEEAYIDRDNSGRKISKSSCKKLARQKVKNGKITGIVSRYDDGIRIYKVKMKKGSKKYELKFHAATGRLLEYEWELTSRETNRKTSYIGAQKAKSIALGQVPGAVIVKVDLDIDDGVPVYEVELYKDGVKYEIKIHAGTGQILEIETD